ncbi:hypothetical protein J6590_010726 [Homalodisca vitripennis]|nr:hypothetical protein J6590_010726 [Homalodisca vitripennis]
MFGHAPSYPDTTPIIDMFSSNKRVAGLGSAPLKAQRSKSLDFGSELEIAQVQILSVTVVLFISTINLVLYRLSPLFCLTRYSHRPVAHEDGQNKA